MYAIKWKESVAEAVRRIGREQCDARLLEPVEPAAADADQPAFAFLDEVQRNARRGLSLLAVIGPSMDADAMRRERTAFRRVARLSQRVATSPNRSSDILEINALLLEIRMRAGYWHLNADDFAALRPGLIRVYGAARRKVQVAAAAGTCEKLDATRDALWAVSDAVKLVERAWPELLKSERKRVRGLMDLMDADEADSAAIWREAAAWMSETPGRWCDRIGGYWTAWRGAH
ncbi:MAG: hypothetical protein AAGF84_09970 [Planctomycetota bacterium]